MKKTIALFSLLSMATACSIQYDAQYGMRLAPPSVRNKSAAEHQEATHSDPTAEPSSTWANHAFQPIHVAESPESAPTYDARESVIETLPSTAGESQDGFASAESLEPATSVEAPFVHARQNSELERVSDVPLWLETLLALFLALIAILAVALGGFAAIGAVLYFSVGEVGAGWILSGVSLVFIVGGYLLFRWVQPMLPQMGYGVFQNRSIRIGLLVLLLLLSVLFAG